MPKESILVIERKHDFFPLITNSPLIVGIELPYNFNMLKDSEGTDKVINALADSILRKVLAWYFSKFGKTLS